MNLNTHSMCQALGEALGQDDKNTGSVLFLGSGCSLCCYETGREEKIPLPSCKTGQHL